MTELTDSFKPTDPDAYQLMADALPLLARRLEGDRLRDTGGQRIRDIQALTAAVQAGTFPGVRPFDSGSQFAAWEASNCARCAKDAYADRNQPPTCPILYALQYALLGTGSISEEMARRCGYTANQGSYVWECPEVEWTPEWKEKWAMLHAEAQR